MKIGLVRHFKVISETPEGWITARQIHDWLQEYDRAEVSACNVDLNSTQWQRCFSSDSPRALKTARALYTGPIIETPTLREPNLQCFSTGPLRLPYSGWRWVLRLAWLTSHRSQLEAKRVFLSNVRQFATELLPKGEGDTLVVSHAGAMIFLRKELFKQGFRGPKFQIPDNGRLYVFER